MAEIVAERLSGASKRAFKGQYPRFAATVDDKGNPNVVPLLSVVAADEDTLIFSRLMVWKTARNLEANRIITINSLGYKFNSWTVRGEFMEYQTQGEYIEFFATQPINRYNAYMGVTKVGVIRVKEVYEPTPISFVSALWRFGRLKGLAENSSAQENHETGGMKMPSEVLDKFNRSLALKYISIVTEQGYPLLAPDFTIRLSENGKLIFSPFQKDHPLYPINQGMKVAATALTAGPVAYQVKGVYKGEITLGGTSAGVVDVQEVYTASPPVPGKRVIPPEPLI
jgi:hypothetical protein